MKDKYNDGTDKDIKNLSDEERALAFSSFSEGNKSLENLLKICYENGITTKFCCAGHKFGDTPYVAFDIDQHSEKHIMSILDLIKDKKGVDFSFVLNYIYHQGTPIFCIYTRMHNRDNIFNMISNSIASQREVDKVPEEYDGILSLHKYFLNEKIQSHILCCQGNLTTKLMLFNLMQNQDIYDALLKANMSMQKNSSVYCRFVSTFLTKKGLIKKLDRIQDELSIKLLGSGEKSNILKIPSESGIEDENSESWRESLKHKLPIEPKAEIYEQTEKNDDEEIR